MAESSHKDEVFAGKYLGPCTGRSEIGRKSLRETGCLGLLFNISCNLEEMLGKHLLKASVETYFQGQSLCLHTRASNPDMGKAIDISLSSTSCFLYLHFG